MSSSKDKPKTLITIYHKFKSIFSLNEKSKSFSFLKIWFEKVLWVMQNVPLSRWLLISFFPFEASRMIFSDVRIQINYNVLPRAHPSGMYFQLGFRQSYWRDCRRFGIHSCKKRAILRNIQLDTKHFL